MPIARTDIEAIDRFLSPLVGQSVWAPRLGVGSFLTLEFGERRVRDGTVHGAWHLWVYCAAWRLDAETEILASSEDPRDALGEAVAQLDGQRVTNALVRAPALELVLTFDRGVRLAVFPIFTSGYEHWLLYTADYDVVTAGPGASWSSVHEPPR